MAAVTLERDDLAPFATIEEAKAQAMIDDALALAARIAPCILTEEFEHPAAAKAILRGAVLRWNDAGSGSVQYQMAGPYSQSIDTKQERRGMFWPSEITELQQLCAEDQESQAFSIDTVAQGCVHADVCALVFGAEYCSCGADLTCYMFPLYEETP